MPTRESARRFHFLREIASGGFGSVYLCKVMHADGFSRLAAVKLLKAQWNDNEEIVHRIRDEARLLGLLRHRNIVDVMDLTSIDGRTAVIMEYLEAVDFRMIIAELTDPQLNAKQARLPVRAALEAMAAVAGALDAAYNRPPIPGEKPLRVIHRDIKPSNIMLDDTGMVKVLDFGVARSEIENRESHTRELQFGSVDYMAPERLFFEPETPASDVYSLSATLFEILALEKLGKARGSPDRHATHLADRLSYLRAQIGLSGTPAIELEALLRSGLAFDHESRPTAAAFFQRARALARLMESEELTSWSERELPPMVSRFQSDHRKDNPLFDRVLTEDSLALVSANLDTKPPPVSGDIQRGALSELSSASAVFTPSPATGAPRLPTLEDAPDLTDPGGWEDIPTTIGTANLDEPIITRHHVEEKPPLPIAVPPDPSDPLADAQTISMLHPAASSQKMAHTEDDPTIHMRTPLGIRAGKPRTRQPETPDTPPPEDTAPSKKPAFSPLWIVIGIIGGCLFPVSIIALGAVVFVLNAQENISAREVEFAEEYASRVEGEAVAGEAVEGEAAGGEAVTVDSVAGEGVAGEDVAGEGIAGEGIAGEGIAG
ncbi:MAG: serine/threonine-protein kinase, partial [Myxococcota bacterium]|nr:serine/threonine-protein kinase [Myxococcota bacterium]